MLSWRNIGDIEYVRERTSERASEGKEREYKKQQVNAIASLQAILWKPKISALFQKKIEEKE